MNARAGEPPIDPAQLEREVVARDREMALGGLESDLEGRVLRAGSSRCRACAASEVAGLGGGMHRYRALEGIFLGGCIFFGRAAGRAAAAAGA